ncbi:hypothetical protein [Algoriphagus boritolerans]|uniref:hypothetical protein n=1 Tax=Algoriphagus boritolerans TaxID=308111 RepID=UPI000ACF4297
MQKIIRWFFLIIGSIWGLNALYVFFFTSPTDEFRVFGAFETNKITAGLIYTILSVLIFWSHWMEKKNQEKKNLIMSWTKKQLNLLQVLIVISIFFSTVLFMVVFELGEKFGKALAHWF